MALGHGRLEGYSLPLAQLRHPQRGRGPRVAALQDWLLRWLVKQPHLACGLVDLVGEADPAGLGLAVGLHCGGRVRRGVARLLFREGEVARAPVWSTGSTGRWSGEPPIIT